MSEVFFPVSAEDQKSMLLRSIAQQPLLLWVPFMPVMLNLLLMVFILAVNNAVIGGWKFIAFLHVVPLHAFMAWLTARDVNWFNVLRASFAYPRTSKNFVKVSKGVKYVPA